MLVIDTSVLIDYLFENLRKELRRLALSEVEFIKKLIKADIATPETNTKLRKPP